MSRPLRLLLLDDDPDDAFLVVRTLAKSGLDFTWTLADREADFLAALDDLPDVILADYSMPLFDPYRALDLLRLRGADIPVIVVSGTISEEAAVDVMLHGASDYVIKDRLGRLASAIDRAIERRRLRVEGQAAAAALRASELDYQFLLGEASDAIIVSDAERRVVTVNRQCCALLGYEAEELLGRDFLEFVDEDDLARQPPRLAELATGAAVLSERRLRRRDGTLVHVESHARQLPDGRILLVVRDISERLLAERRLREAEREFRSLVEQSSAVMYRTPGDHLDDVLYVSPRIVDLVGVPPQEWLERSNAVFVEMLHPDDRDRVLAHEQHANRTGEPFRIEFRFVHRDGRVVWVQDEAQRILDEQGKPLYWQGFWIDVTEQKLAALAVREADERYRSLVEQLPVAVYTEDGGTDGRTAYMSPQIERLTGYPSGSFTTGLESWLPIVHPDDRARFAETWGHCDATGEPFELEFRCLTPAGDVIWLHNRAVRASNGAGAPEHWRGIVSDISDRKRAAEATALLAAVVESATDAIIGSDLDGRVIVWNRAAEELFGYRAGEVIGQSFELIVPDERRDEIQSARAAVLAGAVNVRFETVRRRRDGSLVDVAISVSPMRAADGRAIATVAISHDITERKRFEQALRESEARFRLLAEHASDLIFRYRVRPEPATEYASPATERITGYAPEEFYADPMLQFALVHADDRPVLEQMLSPHAEDGVVQFRWMHRSGALVWLEVAVEREVAADGAVVAIQGIGRDITERKEFERQLAQQMFYDPLTGLPNRALFENRLSHAASRAAGSSRDIAVLAVDIDRFEVINYTLGRERADQVLTELAERLRQSVRAIDTTARLESDELVVLIEDVQGTSLPVETATHIIRELGGPLTVDGHDIHTTASVGIAVGRPDHGFELLRDAQIALNAAKASGRNRFQLFDASMHLEAVAQLEREAQLRRALTHGELRVFYQPVIALSTGSLTGMEALVRWEHPEEGLLAPGRFIPLAEETGLIVPLGGWVLAEACRQARVWNRTLRAADPLVVSVNVSERQFAQPGLVDEVARVLADTGLAPQQLKIEITETILLQDVEATTAKLHALKELGVALAIDDFGTGYSSLSYLTRFPIDTVKIDRSFISGASSGDRAAAIVSGIAILAHALGMDVTAEGIETAGHVARARLWMCDVGQGYFYSRPIPPEEFARLLDAD